VTGDEWIRDSGLGGAMSRRRVGVLVVLLLVLVLVLAGSVAAQINTDQTIRQVRIHLTFANGVCESSASVTLMGHNGPPAQGSANDQCVVDFDNVPQGTYHLYVSGPGVPNTDSGTITLSSGSPDEIEVKVNRANDPNHISGSAGGSLVSASDLAVPDRARKEFDKANELIGKQDFKQAIQKLNRAVAIYPAYAPAYNNLGVLYSRLGDHVQERANLQKAISLDDHMAAAYLNLGKMNVVSGDYASAEKALSQAAQFDPNEAMTWVLLAYCDYMQGRFDETIAHSQKAHQLPGGHAFAHLVAAHAFLKKRQGESAISELELFLKEEPTGPRADNARKELETVQGIVRELAKRASK